ncbi:hypothetical protein AVEN_166298-1 [Araneus ventricosus]|uniref:Uncharacterized protein n=1 Tax=Araneus ventricosus TaxID=182803 RepID=A0A4Y2W353_ARAVE|nr:hypothetical protein AVEN_166298-1 [Araneus ventricosus]
MQAYKAHKLLLNLRKIAGSNRRINQKQRRILYKMVAERTHAHGAVAWCSSPSVKIANKLSLIQRQYVLSIIRAYRTIPTAVLQVILGIPPLHLQLQYEALLTSLFRQKLQITLSPNLTTFQPHGLEK